MTLALVSSRRSLLASSAPTKWRFRVGRAGGGFYGGTAAAGRGLGKGGAADGQDKPGVGALHRGDGIAGIGRPGEGVWPFDADDVGDLHDIEQGGDPRGDVLAAGGGGRHEGVELGHQAGGERRHVLRQGMGIGGVIGLEHLGHARDLRGSSSGAVTSGSCDQRGDLAQKGGGGHSVESGVLDGGIVVFDEEGLHCHTLSTTIAMPCPPPMHMVISPYRAPVRWSS
jgi:hypothetical protein